MSLPFEMDAPPAPRRVVIRIYTDPAANVCGYVRMYLRLTTRELADRIGCSVATLQDIEAGRLAVSRRMGRRLLGLLPRSARLDWLGIPHRGKPD